MSVADQTPIKLPISQRWLNTKGFIFSLYYHFWLSVDNFNKIKSLHNLVDDEEVIEYTVEQRLMIRQVATTIKIVQNKAPWKPKCYNTALLARKLLTQYEIPCLMKIGFRKRNNRIEGHAWVRCNQVIVSGYLPDLKTYNVLKPIKKKSDQTL